MLVVVDMGNTNITMGLFKDDQLIGNYRLTTKLQRTSDEYGFMILAFLSAYNVTVEDIKDVIISSVVPKIMYSFTNSIRNSTNHYFRPAYLSVVNCCDRQQFSMYR